MIRGLLLVALVGCASEATPPPAERIPIRWQLVERHFGYFPDRGVAGDGRVDPEATVLAFEPVYPEDLADASRGGPPHLSVEIVEFFPNREAVAGQPISATVRVANASPRAWYRLRVDPPDPRVRILGERVRTVHGPETATFRFTSAAPGKRGITVEVEEIE